MSRLDQINLTCQVPRPTRGISWPLLSFNPGDKTVGAILIDFLEILKVEQMFVEGMPGERVREEVDMLQRFYPFARCTA
jgi:hypothetical protein